MTNQIITKLYPSGSGANIHLSTHLIKDSSFQFKLGDNISISIDDDRLVIEKA